MLSLEIEGADAMLRRLDQLDKRVRREVLRSAVTRTGRALARDVKDRVPRRSGRLRKAIASRFSFRDGRAEVAVGGKKKQGARTLHLVEFGTAGRIQTTTGRRTGSMPPRPVLRPALARAQPLLTQHLREALRKFTGAE